MITAAMSTKHKARKGLLFLTLLGVGACNPTAEEVPANTEAPTGRTGMYEASPLAVAMRSMATDMESLRAKADAGTLTVGEVDAMISAHAAMTSADATKPEDIKPSFEGYAEAYLIQLQDLRETIATQASREARLEAFNAALTTCVACHQEHCPGPISRIEKIKVQP